jgi:hypothetical protein
MLLVDPILEIFHLTNADGDTMFLIVALDSSFIGLAAVSGSLAAESVTWPLGLGVPGAASSWGAAFSISPLPLDFDIRLVHPPTDPHRLLAPMERGFQRGR